MKDGILDAFNVALSVIFAGHAAAAGWAFGTIAAAAGTVGAAAGVLVQVGGKAVEIVNK